MKQKHFLGLLITVLAIRSAFGQPSQLWENWGFIDFPPQIDALTFINHAGGEIDLATSSLFQTANTLNYTNQGFMIGNPGFNFQTFPSSAGQARWARSFANLGDGVNTGVIDTSGQFFFVVSGAAGLLFGNLSGSSQFIVHATNIINSGSISMDASSLLQLTGRDIDLHRGTLNMTTTTSTTAFGTNFVGPALFNAGELAGYWGVGTANINYFKMPPQGQASLLNPASLFVNPAFNQDYNVTNRQFFPFTEFLEFFNPLYYVNDTGVIGSNRWVQAVVLLNTNNAFANSVYFPNFGFGPAFEIAVQWQWLATNLITRAVATNYLVLEDNFGEVTNLETIIHDEVNPQAPFPRLTQIPITYTFTEGFPYSSFFAAGFAPTATLPSVPNPAVLGPAPATNQYAAYEAIFTGGTQLATDVAGGNPTNLAGRIELNAQGTLNLNHAHVNALNYALLKCTNHFLGSPGAQIASPNMDIFLATTNGTMTVSNLVLPFINHPEGTIQLWSGRWTNIDNANVTNAYHVLFVASDLAPTVPPRIQNLSLSVSNSTGIGDQSLYISDILNVTTNLVLSAQRITITTNASDSITPEGQLNLLNANILWSNATPGLQYLTNWGQITTENAVYFGGSHTSPYSNGVVDVPYQAFVNHGVVTNFSSLIWALYFENSGIFQSQFGSIILQQAINTVLEGGVATNANGIVRSTGAFIAPVGDILISSGSLFVSNHVLAAGGALTLSVPGNIDDGSLNTPTYINANSAFSVTNKNLWVAENGINLPVTPAKGSLLGTTIYSFDTSYAEIINTWAGVDKHCSTAGFTDPTGNAAIGHVIFDALDPDSLFTFVPATGANAMYVDELEFADYATNRDAQGNWTAFNINPGMKIYFAQAIANGQSIADKVDGKNGGGFCWVKDYNVGFFSSTTNFGCYCSAFCPARPCSIQTLSDGTLVRLNQALVSSCNPLLATPDAISKGTVNGCDTTPLGSMPYGVTSSSDLNFKVAYTNHPVKAAVISWNTAPYCTNYLYYANSSTSTNWQMVTNFVTGAYGGRVNVLDPIQTPGMKFYKARVAMP